MDLKRSEAIKRGKARSRLMGRLVGAPLKVTDAQIMEVIDLPSDIAAKKLGISQQWYIVRRRNLQAPTPLTREHRNLSQMADEPIWNEAWARRE